MFSSVFCKILVQTILQDYSLLLTHETSEERQKMHTPYADTDVLQTLCVDSVFRSGLTNVTCNLGRTKCACCIVSLDICP